jgi:hypothetical protein
VATSSGIVSTGTVTTPPDRVVTDSYYAGYGNSSTTTSTKKTGKTNPKYGLPFMTHD